MHRGLIRTRVNNARRWSTGWRREGGEVLPLGALDPKINEVDRYPSKTKINTEKKEGRDLQIKEVPCEEITNYTSD